MTDCGAVFVLTASCLLLAGFACGNEAPCEAPKGGRWSWALYEIAPFAFSQPRFEGVVDFKRDRLEDRYVYSGLTTMSPKEEAFWGKITLQYVLNETACELYGTWLISRYEIFDVDRLQVLSGEYLAGLYLANLIDGRIDTAYNLRVFEYKGPTPEEMTPSLSGALSKIAAAS